LQKKIFIIGDDARKIDLCRFLDYLAQKMHKNACESEEKVVPLQSKKVKIALT